MSNSDAKTDSTRNNTDFVDVLAQGVLMCRYRVDRQSALSLLDRMAAESGTSVSDVAAGLITEHERAVGIDTAT